MKIYIIVIILLTFLTLFSEEIGNSREVGTLTGIVTDTITGLPIEGVLVEIVPIQTRDQLDMAKLNSKQIAKTENEMTRTSRATTDDSGMYVILATEIGNYNLQATAAGYETYNNQIEIVEGLNTHNFTLMIEDTVVGNLIGFVTDTITGLPIEGVLVEIVPVQTRDQFDMAELNSDQIAETENEMTRTSRATTDDSGYYVILAIELGNYNLEATFAGYETYNNQIEIVDGPNTHDFTLMIEDTVGGNLTGMVTDTITGLPLEGVLVEIVPVQTRDQLDMAKLNSIQIAKTENEMTRTSRATTDDSGYYLILAIELGNYNLEATAAGYVTYNNQIEIEEGLNTHNFSLIPAEVPGDGPANAIVVDALPFFASGDTSIGHGNWGYNLSPDVFYSFTTETTIWLEHVHSCGSAFDTYLRIFFEDMSPLASDDDGCASWGSGDPAASYISITMLEPGTYIIMLEGYSSYAGYYELTMEDDIPVIYGDLAGTVLDTDTWLPIEGVTVEISPVSARNQIDSDKLSSEKIVSQNDEITRNSRATTNANGYYEILDFEIGLYNLEATKEGYDTYTAQLDLIQGLNVHTFYLIAETVLQGDTPETAIAIDALPYFASGTTSIDYTNWGEYSSPDVFYTITLEEPAILDIQACGSTFDTYLRLFDDTMTQVAYNNDSCGEQSFIEQYEAIAGSYYIMLEGYSSNTGYYELVVEEYLSIIYGDVDDNGIVEAYDASNVLQYVVCLEPDAVPLPWDEETILKANVDGNDLIGAYDASLILQYVAGVIDIFPVEEAGRHQAPEAAVEVTFIDNELIFTASGELYGFEVEISSNIRTPDTQILYARNGNKVALASAEVIIGKFLRIPVASNHVTIDMVINNANKRIDLTNIPSVTSLISNYPNPFNPVTTITYEIAESGNVLIQIYNIRSQLVTTLVNEQQVPGTYSLQWNANGQASGVYFYKMKFGRYTSTKKMILLK
jgi:5-hydroxyisourate hydrolase-like protein (transthyretin family)